MIRVHAGPRGYRSRAPLTTVARAVIVLAAALLVLGGCAAKKAQPAAPGAGAGGLGEKGIGPSASSLTEFQQGTLGSNQGGPLTDVHFDYNDFTIRAQDSQILRSNASWLNSNSKTRVQVEGHCDERGSEEYNIALGAKRAQAAKDYLVTLGVAGDRLSTISYGKELPLCTDHDEPCWERNRRAHFVVTQ